MFLPAFQDSFREAIKSPFPVDVVEIIFQTLATGSGTLTGSYTIFLGVSSPTVIDHGDGNTTNATSSDLTEYTIIYAGASNPVIKISKAVNVIDMVIELTSDFTIDYADVSNKDVFTNLLTFINSGANKADTTGTAEEEFIDIGQMTLILE